MKLFWNHLRVNAVLYLVNTLSFLAVILFYYRLIGTLATLLLAGILALYALCMSICRLSQGCYRKREREGTLDSKYSFWIAIGICAPVYWCWMIVGIIPIFSFYGFLLTGLPAYIVGWMPLKATADLVDVKWLFWVAQILIFLLTLCLFRFLLSCFW